MHRSLYGGDMITVLSPSIRTAFGVCAAYNARTGANQAVFYQLLDSGVDRLVGNYSPRATLAEQLASVQVMILYHTMMLFGGDIRHRFLAEQQEFLLAQWTASLEREAEASSYSTDESWALYESARRTVVISYLIRCVYLILKYKTGHFIRDLVHLPVSTHPQSFPNSGTVISYHEFVKYWEDGWMSDFDDFGHMILVACKGVAAV
jgi:hypothetical protein